MEDNFSFLTTDEIEELFDGVKTEPLKEDDGEEQKDNPVQQEKNKIENNDDENKTTDGEIQESGGSGKSEKQEDTESGGSPNFYSSIAKALRDEGIFPDLDNLDDIKDAASFRNMIESQVDSKLSEQQKRVAEALNYGVEPDEIQKMENTRNYLSSITEQQIVAEDKNGENLRKSLIFQDLVNRGYSREKAVKEVEKSLNAGTDIEDAKEALEANKVYYNNVYNSIVAKAKKDAEDARDSKEKWRDSLRKTIDEKENAFGAIPLDKKTKDKIYEYITKPVYRDKNGNYLTTLQKFEVENNDKFLLSFGAFYALTDGFTNFSKFFSPVEQKATKKGISSLEDMLTGKTSPESGSITAMGGDGDNYFSDGWDIDLGK